jgi:AcrR family transcriptional regulator
MPNSMSSDMTKRLMVQSLKKYMAKKPLEKISIREITEDSGVNRQTFYYHFEDIYSMVKWMYEEEAVKLIEGLEGVLLWQDGILQLLRYIEENKAICLCTLNSLGHQYLKRFFYDDVHAIIEKTVYSFARQMNNVSSDYAEFLTHIYSIALAALVESWLLGEIKQTPEELIKFIDITINDQLRGALQRNGKFT